MFANKVHVENFKNMSSVQQKPVDAENLFMYAAIDETINIIHNCVYKFNTTHPSHIIFSFFTPTML